MEVPSQTDPRRRQGRRDHLFQHPEFRFRDNVESKLIFPKNVFAEPVTGEEIGAIGQNVIGGIVDEIAEMAVTERSRRTRDQGTYDQAVALYNAIAARRGFWTRGRCQASCAWSPRRSNPTTSSTRRSPRPDGGSGCGVVSSVPEWLDRRQARKTGCD